jgi:hypothetical protein
MTHSSNIIELSTKYQVLSDKTSFVGVVKQNEKSDVEMITVTQPKVQPEPVVYNPPSYDSFAGFGGGCAMSSMS